MTAPNDAMTEKSPRDEGPGRELERRIRLSRLSLLAERAWEASLWPFAVLGLFLALSLFELWALVPPLAHRILLGLFGLALLVSFVPLVRIAWPSRGEALRRLERKAGIPHRPATSYEDTLSGSVTGDGETLWRAHRARLARLVRRLRPGWPAPRTDRQDPFALRLALVLVLAVGLMHAGGRVGERLQAAFVLPAGDAAAAAWRLDAWVAPPAYTGKPPIVLSDGRRQGNEESFRALTIPQNSTLVIRAQTGGGRVAVFHALGEEPAQSVSPKSAKADRIEFAVPLGASGSAAVEVGGRLAAKWRFDVTPDQPPTIAMAAPPARTPRSALRLFYRAHDDYGLVKGEARFALSDKAEPGTSGEPLMPPPVVELSLPRRTAEAAEGNAQKDLTAHPWAGLKVRMTLVAEDQAKQVGMSEAHEFILPEREFKKPLARAVVEQRKKLVGNARGAPEVGRALDALTIGADRFLPDKSVYLGLRSVYWRLRSDTSRDSLVSAVEQLWQIALNIEDGDMPEAERALHEAQEKLKDAIERNASEADLKKAMDEMRQALSDYLKSMQEQAAQNADQPMPDNPNGDQTLTEQDLEKMLQSIENLAKSGAKDMAQKMLSEMRDMLDRMQMGGSESAEQQQMSQMMGELGDLIAEQQKLLDDTFAATREQQAQNGREQEYGIEGELNQSDRPNEPQFGFGELGLPWERELQQSQTPEEAEADQAERDAAQSDQQQGSEMGQLGQMGERGDQHQQNQGGQSRRGQGQQGQAGPRGPGQRGQQGQQGQGGQQGQPQRGGQAGQQAQGRGQRGGAGGQLGARQGELRERLNSMLEQMRGMGGKPPDQLEGAGSAMGDAEGAIAEKNLDRATQQQTLALDRMRQGAQGMAEQMMQAMQGQRGPGRGDSRDPLGRPDRTQGPDYGLSVKVPQEIDIQRAREIMDELRRRLGDPARPPIELDYLERLIRRF